MIQRTRLEFGDQDGFVFLDDKPSITRSLRSFIEKYKPSEAWVVNLVFNETMMVGTTSIRFLSFFGLQNMLRELVNSIETAYKVEEKAFPYRIIRRKNR